MTIAELLTQASRLIAERDRVTVFKGHDIALTMSPAELLDLVERGTPPAVTPEPQPQILPTEPLPHDHA